MRLPAPALAVLMGVAFIAGCGGDDGGSEGATPEQIAGIERDLRAQVNADYAADPNEFTSGYSATSVECEPFPNAPDVPEDRETLTCTIRVDHRLGAEYAENQDAEVILDPATGEWRTR